MVARLRSETVPPLALRHGQALWVMRELFPGLPGVAGPTLDSYIKYLRREGVPFAAEELGVGTGQTVTYRYEQLMELAVALTLRTQGVLAQDIPHLLSEFRTELRRIYRIAYLQRRSGMGAPVDIALPGEPRFRASGIWLDLRLRYFETGVLSSSGPCALGPAAALKEFVRHGRDRFFRPLISLSDLAEAVVELAPAAPEIRRGRS